MNGVAVTGNNPGAAILLSVFFIILCFIPICPKHDIRPPVRGAAHLLTNGFQVNTGVAFDDQFIIDVSDYEIMPESFHGIAEDIAADGLVDILYKLWFEGFNAFPFPCGANTFISDRFSAELIGSNPGLHICKPASRRKLDEEHVAFEPKSREIYTQNLT